MTDNQVRKIKFTYADVSVRIRARLQTKQIVAKIFRDQQAELHSLLFVFCSDQYLLDLNQRFLKHDTLTDVITFGLSAEGQPIDGEVYISSQRVMDNAQTFKSPFDTELKRVMFHGALHLCGFGDKSAREKHQIRALEDYYLSLL